MSNEFDDLGKYHKHHMKTPITEDSMIEHYSQKVRELNELFDNGMISQAEYEELVKDFTDVEAIREDIKGEKFKIMAAKIVDAVSKLVKVL